MLNTQNHKDNNDMGIWKRLGHAGVGVTEVLIALGIGTAVVGTAGYFSIEAFKSDKNEEFLMWLEQRRSEMMYTLQNESGWENLVKMNSDMTCVETDPQKCFDLQKPQAMDFPLGNQTLKGGDPGLGLNSDGQFCTSFDAAKGNSSCPVGVELRWQMVCGSETCVDAQPKVSIKFSHSTNSGLKLNLSTYNINFYKDSRTQNLNDVCEGLGGKYVSGKCNLTLNNCNPSSPTGATYPLGFDAAGQVICGQPNLGTCSSNDIVTGFNADGSVICSPKCTTPSNPQPCVGEWGTCVQLPEDCGINQNYSPGNCNTVMVKVRTYTIQTPAANGGPACAHPNGFQEYCPPANGTCTKCDHVSNQCATAYYGDGEQGPGCYIAADRINGMCSFFPGGANYAGPPSCP